MKLIEANPIAYSDITSSNLTLETAWTAGTYALGVERRHADDDGNEWIWQVVADPSTTDEPSFSSTDWSAVGVPNKYAPFYGTVSFKGFRPTEVIATNADTLEWEIDVTSPVTGLYMEGLACTEVSIVVTETTTGDIYDETHALDDQTDYQFDYWRWFFLPIEPTTTLTVTDINFPIGSSVAITVTNTGSTAECSAIVMGMVNEYGTTLGGASAKLKSRSIRRTTDLTTELRRRTPATVISWSVHCNRGTGAFLKRKLDGLEGKLAVFIPSDSRPEFTSFSFLSDYSQVSLPNDMSQTTIETETP